MDGRSVTSPVWCQGYRHFRHGNELPFHCWASFLPGQEKKRGRVYRAGWWWYPVLLHFRAVTSIFAPFSSCQRSCSSLPAREQPVGALPEVLNVSISQPDRCAAGRYSTLVLFWSVRESRLLYPWILTVLADLVPSDKTSPCRISFLIG